MSLRTFELRRKLRRARKTGDIYHAARYVVMLRHLGKNVTLLPKETENLFSALEATRRGEGLIPVHPGYEIARWVLLIKTLNLGLDLELTQDDLQTIQAAADLYYLERNLYQLASLKFTCDHIGVELELNLTEEEHREVDAIIATME